MNADVGNRLSFHVTRTSLNGMAEIGTEELYNENIPISPLFRVDLKLQSISTYCPKFSDDQFKTHDKFAQQKIALTLT